MVFLYRLCLLDIVQFYGNFSWELIKSQCNTHTHLNSIGASKACIDLGPQVFSPTWKVTQELRTQLRQCCRWLVWNKPSAGHGPQLPRVRVCKTLPTQSVQVKWWRTLSVQHHPFPIIPVKSHCNSNPSLPKLFTYCFYSSKVLALPPHHFSLACALRYCGFFKKNQLLSTKSSDCVRPHPGNQSLQYSGSVTLESFFLAMGFFFKDFYW